MKLADFRMPLMRERERERENKKCVRDGRRDYVSTEKPLRTY